MQNIIKSTKEFSTIEKIKLDNLDTTSVAKLIKDNNEAVVTGVNEMFTTSFVEDNTQQEVTCVILMCDDSNYIVSGSVCVKSLDEIIEAVNNSDITKDELHALTFKFDKRESKSGNKFVNMSII